MILQGRRRPARQAQERQTDGRGDRAFAHWGGLPCAGPPAGVHGLVPRAEDDAIALRGWAMHMDSDHAFAQVRLHSGGDAAWVAWPLVLLAALQGAIETGLQKENPYEATAELLMLITGGYLLGRSVVAWLRARSGTHVDLQEE